MATYICHHEYNGKDLRGAQISVPRGAALAGRDVLSYEGRPVCMSRSLAGKMHFAVNDDGCGLERGALTYALAYAPRERFVALPDRIVRRRFTEKEMSVLIGKWAKYQKPHIDCWHFSDDFFTENVEILRQIAASVNIAPELEA